MHLSALLLSIMIKFHLEDYGHLHSGIESMYDIIVARTTHE